MKIANSLIAAYFVLCIHCVYAQGTATYPDAKPKKLHKVSLQLQWLHQFQFAGYYAALEKGYYREMGLDVEIRPGGEGIRHFDEVSEGRATYGVGSSGLLLSYLKGKPLVALAVIFQHSQDILLAKKSSGIKHPNDLIGKRVMMLEGDGNAVFRTMFVNEEIALDKIKIIPSSFKIDDLINNKVDAFNSYTSNEPFYLLSKGIEVSEINPIDFGVDYYGDCIYTSRSELEKNPERVKNFRNATLKGWHYALDHKEEIIVLIFKKYSKQKTLAHLRFEANAIEEAVLPKLIEIGHMNPGRWQFMASTYEKLNIIEPGYSLDNFIYDPATPQHPKWLKLLSYLAAAIIIIAAIIILVLIQFNKKLHKVVDNRTKELSGVNLDLRTQIDENKKTTKELQINELRLQTLQELNNMRGASEKELTHFAMEAAVKLTRSTIGYIAFMNEDETILTMYAWSRQAMKECAINSKPIEYSVAATGLWGEAVRQRKAMITNDYEAQNPYKKGTPDGHVGIMRHMNAPIFDGDRIVIIAGVGNKSTDYGDDDVRQLTLFMSGLWTILRRRRVEDELKKSEKNYRKLFEMSADAIFIVDKKSGRYLDANTAAEKLSGHSLSEIKKLSTYDLTPIDWKKRAIKIQDSYDATDLGEVVYVRPDGIKRIAQLTSVPLNENTVYGIAQDITKRKKDETELEKSKSLLEAALEATADGILIVDESGHWSGFNQKFIEIWGIPQNIWESGEDGIAINYVMDKIKEPKEFTARIKELYENKKEDSFDIIELKDNRILERFSHPQTIGNKVVGRVWSFRDVTEQRMLEKQVQHTRKMESIGTLAGGIAHDFNNILSGILGYSQLAQSHINNTKKAEDYIDQVRKGAQRATELVQQILTFSRQTEYQKKPFKIYYEIKETLKLLRSTIPSTIEITTNFNSTATVLADPTKIHQLIMNLCTNAYHAMRKTGGVLSVSLTDCEVTDSKQIGTRKVPIGKYVKLKIKDTGHGMDRNILEKAFDPYFTTKKKGQGTGLGLALVQAIVDEHDGFLEVHSEVTKGTVFKIYFPEVKEKVVQKTQKKLTISQEIMGDETIMIVDDEKSIRNILYDLLTTKGYQVFTFKNGAEALDAFKAAPQDFDLILTDMTMPGITGDKLAAEILKTEPELPIILCTGFSENITKEAAKKMGIKKFLQKPVTNHEILVSIRNIFDSNFKLPA